MHRQINALWQIDLELTAVSQLLVQGTQMYGQPGAFYQARHPDTGKETCCIPASTLKGVWRSAAEQILRSFADWLACDPFADKPENNAGGKSHPPPGCSCSSRLEKDERINTPQIYSALCPACRLFGATVHAGLLRVEDSWLQDDLLPDTKTGIAIDRFTGGVKQGALFTLKPLPIGARFATRMTLINPELWQIGLLALVCREMDEGRVRLGSGTRKGLGYVRATWWRATLRYPRVRYAAHVPHGTGRIVSANRLADVAGEGLDPAVLPDVAPLENTHWSAGEWIEYDIRGQDLAELRRACVEDALAPRLREGYTGFDYADPCPHAPVANGESV
ncbi:MAG: RAMP superfamily CRISPR-associated protein [Caldilineaceae bacterium]